MTVNEATKFTEELLPSVSQAEELRSLQQSVTATILTSSMWPKLGTMEHSWGQKLFPAANVQKTAAWAADTLATLAADGSGARHPNFTARVQALYDLAERHRRRLTMEHFLLDSLVMELVSHPFIGHLAGRELSTHYNAVIALSDQAVYDGRRLSVIVIELDRLVTLAEAKPGVDTSALNSVKALLMELELRVSILE
jgi:hypothetical protein